MNSEFPAADASAATGQIDSGSHPDSAATQEAHTETIDPQVQAAPQPEPQGDSPSAALENPAEAPAQMSFEAQAQAAATDEVAEPLIEHAQSEHPLAASETQTAEPAESQLQVAVAEPASMEPQAARSEPQARLEPEVVPSDPQAATLELIQELVPTLSEITAQPTAQEPPPEPAQATAIEEISPPAQKEAQPDEPVSTRQTLVARFEQWVDRMLAGEAPPQGLPPEVLAELDSNTAGMPAGDCDLYTLFSGLTSLTGEVRLQGRAFKQLTDTLQPLVELPEKTDALLEASEAAAARDQEREIAAQAAQAEDENALPSPKTMLEVLVDMHDRLKRGLHTFDTAFEAQRSSDNRGWMQRLLGSGRPDSGVITAIQAMREGYALTLSRVSAALHEWSIDLIGAVGEPFDPNRMIAIDVRPAGDQSPGTVVEVNRSGCALHGRVLVTAQVTVAR